MIAKQSLTAAGLGVLLASAMACSSTGSPLSPGPLTPATTTVTRPPTATGSYEISGTVTELTENGPMPVAGIYVELCGYDGTESDANGFYKLSGIPNGHFQLYVRKVEGFKDIAPNVSVTADTRFDFRLERE